MCYSLLSDMCYWVSAKNQNCLFSVDAETISRGQSDGDREDEADECDPGRHHHNNSVPLGECFGWYWSSPKNVTPIQVLTKIRCADIVLRSFTLLPLSL